MRPPLSSARHRVVPSCPSAATLALAASVLLAAASGCGASASKAAEEPSAVPPAQPGAPPAPEPRNEGSRGLGLQEGGDGAGPQQPPAPSVTSTDTKDAESGGEEIGGRSGKTTSRRARGTAVQPGVDQTVALIEEYERIMVGGSEPGRSGGVGTSKPPGCDEACSKLAEMAREVDRLCDLVGSSDERCEAKRRSLSDIRQSSALASCSCAR